MEWLDILVLALFSVFVLVVGGVRLVWVMLYLGHATRTTMQTQSKIQNLKSKIDKALAWIVIVVIHPYRISLRSPLRASGSICGCTYSTARMRWMSW